MNRPISNLNSSIFVPLFGMDEIKIENYIKKIGSFERNSEKKLIEILSKLDIKACVKSDPYSLPYNHEILVTLNGESYLNGAYEIKKVFKEIVKELLLNNINRFRFYFYINIIGHERPQEGPEKNDLSPLLSSFGKIEYRFRYHY